MSLSFFFSRRHCLSWLQGHLPRSRSCRARLSLRPTALAFLPGAKPTACTRRQPHVCEGMTLVQVDGGAPAARYSGSAAGAGGQRDRWIDALGWLPLAGRRASRVATHPPPSCIGNCAKDNGNKATALLSGGTVALQ